MLMGTTYVLSGSHFIKATNDCQSELEQLPLSDDDGELSQLPLAPAPPLSPPLEMKRSTTFSAVSSPTLTALAAEKMLDSTTGAGELYW